VNVGREKPGLNHIFERLLEVASECVRTILTDGINGDGVILVVEIWDSLGRSNQSHLVLA